MKIKKMKKAVSLIVLLILIVSSMGYGLPPPPPDQAGSQSAALGATSTAATKKGFVEIVPGQRVPANTLALYFSDARSQRSMSDACQKDWSACTDSDIAKFSSEDWKVTYNSATKIWKYSDNGRSFITSSSGRYLVGEGSGGGIGIIGWDQSNGRKFDVGTLPPGKTLKDITLVEDNALHFTDGTVMVRNANPIPKEIYEKYKSQIDWKKGFTAGGALPLTNQGSIAYSADSSTGIITTTVKLKDSTTTTWTFAGQTYSSEKGWEIKNGKFTNQKENREIIVESSGNKITEKNTKTKEEIITTLTGQGAAQQRTIERKKDGATTSYEVRDAQNRLLGERVDDDNDGKLEANEDFRHYDAQGRVIAVCYSGNCKGDPSDANTIWLGSNEQGENIYCYGEQENCWTNGQRVGNKWGSEEDACKNPANLQCRAIHERQIQAFFSTAWSVALGQTDFQRNILGPALSLRPGWESLSTWWAPDLTRSWQKWARENFDRLLAAEYITSEWVCDFDEINKVKRPGESATFVEVAPGVIQFVGSITAERSVQKTPMLCQQNQDPEAEEQWVCGPRRVCVEDLCYKDTEEDGEPDQDTPLVGHFYKISWAVKAPADESFTPYVDENGYALKFNVKIFGERELWLYPAQGVGTDQTLQLENGATDKDTIVTYSPYFYDEVCILFGAGAKDRSGDIVTKICADIDDSAAGQIEWEQSGRAGSSGSSTGNVQVETVGRAQI